MRNWNDSFHTWIPKKRQWRVKKSPGSCCRQSQRESKPHREAPWCRQWRLQAFAKKMCGSTKFFFWIFMKGICWKGTFISSESPVLFQSGFATYPHILREELFYVPEGKDNTEHHQLVKRLFIGSVWFPLTRNQLILWSHPRQPLTGKRVIYRQPCKRVFQEWFWYQQINGKKMCSFGCTHNENLIVSMFSFAENTKLFAEPKLLVI